MARSPSAPPLLGLENLAGRRGDRLLFTGLSAKLGPGEALRVTGPNGSGKTTLLRIVCGLLAPEAGTVRWRGEALPERATRQRGEFAFVGHRDALRDALTLLENLRFAQALGGGADTLSPEAALERVGLERDGATLARELSAGQRRRAALARLLLRDAPVWILDEPATALDRDGAALVESMGRDHTDAGGLIVFTSHQPLRLTGGDAHELEPTLAAAA